jgi:diaminopimelate decarboxylase
MGSPIVLVHLLDDSLLSMFCRLAFLLRRAEIGVCHQGREAHQIPIANYVMTSAMITHASTTRIPLTVDRRDEVRLVRSHHRTMRLYITMRLSPLLIEDTVDLNI